METTPNKSKRPRLRREIDLIVVHYTGSMNCAGSVAWFKNPAARVSAHFIIDRDGRLVEFETPEARLWHAGRSQWQGREHCNSRSIGVELVGVADSPFEAEQYDALLSLVRRLCEVYPIQSIVGHEHVSPGRKVDPGPFFAWDWLVDRYIADEFRLRGEGEKWLGPMPAPALGPQTVTPDPEKVLPGEDVQAAVLSGNWADRQAPGDDEDDDPVGLFARILGRLF